MVGVGIARRGDLALLTPFDRQVRAVQKIGTAERGRLALLRRGSLLQIVRGGNLRCFRLKSRYKQTAEA